jgi:hypothetical protein
MSESIQQHLARPQTVIVMARENIITYQHILNPYKNASAHSIQLNNHSFLDLQMKDLKKAQRTYNIDRKEEKGSAYSLHSQHNQSYTSA